ncbi:MAG: hypothetical protein J0G28_03745 [Afipia sp.]|nr:hypothetical protein [Afipia sp.]OJW63876.1 MAG: hypothetical protein BGO65_04415 [Afipia sp. 64-13]
MLDERDFLEALQLAEEMGHARTLTYGLENYRRLAKSSDPAVQQELQRLRGVRDAWVRVENEEGPGSLLNLDHLLVLKHAADGIISTTEIENARRHNDKAKGQVSASAASSLNPDIRNSPASEG